jgi:aminoglycoside phosphotransferase (APT) family kinase protein
MSGTDGRAEVLQGGVANAGAVVRVGDDVLRPAPPNVETTHRFLRHLASIGIAPEPIAVEGDGRERVRFIAGEVSIPPYPAWSQSDAALESVAKLIRVLHEASHSFAREAHDAWNAEVADPESDDSVICHNDACLENVVFRDGVAVALLDFDFAAPGRRSYDVACFARMCVPVDDDVNRGRLGWEVKQLPERLRLIADAYGLADDERAEVVASIDYVIAQHGAFVRRRVEAGDPGFVAMWEAGGGLARFDRRRDWWAQYRDDFVAAMQ